MKIFSRIASPRRLLIFSLLSGLALAAVFFVLSQNLQEARQASLQAADQRLLQVFQSRLEARIRLALSRIQGAELLIASTPPSSRSATKALEFAMNRGDPGKSHSAAVVLDERARILASRRQGGVPPPGRAEKRSWSQAVAALRSKKKGAPGGRYHIEAGSIEGVSALLIAAPSPSTKGYWGVVLTAENLMSVGRGEFASGDSVFVLSEPEQTVIYARMGSGFIHKAIGLPFDKGLGPRLDILACCDVAAFNTVHEGKRRMIQLTFSGGTREFRLVRVAAGEAEAAALGRIERRFASGLFIGWAVLAVAFALLGGGVRRGRGEAIPRKEIKKETYEAPPSNTPFEALSRICEAVARGDHFRDIISDGIAEAAGYLGADRYFSAVYDDDLDQLFEISCANLGDTFRAAIAIGSGELPEHIAVKERDFVEVPAVIDWDEAPEALKNEGIAAVAVFPMRAGDKVVGLMAFYFDEPRELQAAEADICGFIALLGASAVARALALPESLPEI
jgi:hypothetical protein